jgi:hypothetical protein
MRGERLKYKGYNISTVEIGEKIINREREREETGSLFSHNSIFPSFCNSGLCSE